MSSTYILKDKQARAGVLAGQLERSLLLKSIIPSCFDKGERVTTSGLCRLTPVGHLPYKFWVQIGADKTPLNLENFIKLEGYKFNSEQLMLITKHWED